jgi:hypothetical protein
VDAGAGAGGASTATATPPLAPDGTTQKRSSVQVTSMGSFLG